VAQDSRTYTDDSSNASKAVDSAHCVHDDEQVSYFDLLLCYCSVLSDINNKFKLMLMRCAKAYSSSGSVV